jgi:hypothetical protein
MAALCSLTTQQPELSDQDADCITFPQVNTGYELPLLQHLQAILPAASGRNIAHYNRQL